jgi:hypothetical protein
MPLLLPLALANGLGWQINQASAEIVTMLNNMATILAKAPF